MMLYGVIYTYPVVTSTWRLLTYEKLDLPDPLGDEWTQRWMSDLARQAG